MTIPQNPTEQNPTYRLVIWFDQEQTKLNDLADFVTKGLSANIAKKVGYSTEGYLTLSLTGELAEIDKGHSQIIEFVQRTNWNLFRLIDTAGDEIRHQAFQELSGIEQELRAFINRGLIETLGFDWWLSLGSLKIPGQEISEIHKTHHPLELMTIGELIGIVTFEHSEWNEENPIALKDILSILERSSDFDEFRNKFVQKVQKISLWDLVFSKYLGDSAPLWQEVRKKDLQFIIDLRNKVMHHRPVHLGELRALEDKRRKVSSLIASAKTQLSEDEKGEITALKKQARDIFAQLIYERADQNSYSQLYGSLQQSRNTVTVQNLTNEIAGLASAGILSTKETLELQAVAFDQLKALTGFNLVQTQGIILNNLLPLCIQEDPELRIQGSSFRNILADWINGHAQQDAIILLNLVLDSLAKFIGSPKHKTTCWTISTIGFTRSDIVQQLFEYGTQNDNEAGDDTFSTLTWLSLSLEQRKVLLDNLHLRAEKRYNNRLVWSLARLADPTSVSVIFDQWLQDNNITEKSVDTSLAFTALREIADANEDDIPLQDEIWQKATDAVEKNSKDLYMAFDIGHLVIACNSTYVVPTLLRWHGQHPDWFQNPSWARYLAQERLGSSVKPRQLEGWSNIDDKNIYDYLRNDACFNTNDDNFYTTQEWIIKEAAWKTVLRAGYAEALTWFDPAVSGETGRFVRQKIMEYLAAFRIDPLPEMAIGWITEEFNDVARTDGRELSYRMAAVRLARSVATQDAFRALLDFGYTNEGQVLQQSADAVVAVALSLLSQGQTGIVDQLVQLATASNIKRQRLVSINALEAIATYPEYHKLLIPHRDKFIALIHEKNLENVEHGHLLNMLSLLPGDFSDEFENELVAWARHSDRWISIGALEALARHGELEKNLDLMRDVLNLEQDGDSWRLAAGEIHVEWALYIIGLLYNRNVSAYTHIVSTLLTTQHWHSATQIIRLLVLTHEGEDKPQLPNEVINALLQRLVGRMSRFYSEPETFDVMARLKPDSLVSQELMDAIPNWMPDSCIALANALIRANISAESMSKCLVILETLAEDSMYSVRRAAYRALARRDENHLYELCKSWLDSPILQLNLRAAEACGWVESITADKQDIFQELKGLASSHSHSNVPEALKRSLDERRHRQWARIYLEKVRSVEGNDNNEVLQAWRYGDALTQVGDDEIRELLRSHLSTKQLPTNIRFWINKHILEKLENNWKKVTQKWPEPWIDSRGTIERGNGQLFLPTNEAIAVQYSVWLNPATIPAEKHSWGGNIFMSWGDAINIDHATLEFEDGRKGDVQFSGITSNAATFHGKGRFPA